MRNAVRAVKAMLLAGIALVLVAPAAYAAGPTVLVAHRGVGTSTQVKYGFAEESLPAFDWAVDNGADIVDFDAQVTSDNQLVVMHDDTLNRTTNCTGGVRQRTLSYIKNCWMELPIDLNHNGDDDNTNYHPPSSARRSFEGFADRMVIR
jgi:glycerophosphoryl diester phosphodiesterase